MINRKDITNAAKRMLRQHRGLADPQIIHPQRDWFIGLGVAGAVFGLIVWWSITAHVKHSNTASDSSAEVVNTDSVYREGQVKSALEIFEERSRRYDEIMASSPTEVEIPVIENEVVEEDEPVVEETPQPEALVPTLGE